MNIKCEHLRAVGRSLSEKYPDVPRKSDFLRTAEQTNRPDRTERWASTRSSATAEGHRPATDAQPTTRPGSAADTAPRIRTGTHTGILGAIYYLSSPRIYLIDNYIPRGIIPCDISIVVFGAKIATSGLGP